MHTINWHPSSEMLLNHAMGNTNEAESLIISSHIAYCTALSVKQKLLNMKIWGLYLKNHEELNVSKTLWKNLLVKLEDVRAG